MDVLLVLVVVFDVIEGVVLMVDSRLRTPLRRPDIGQESASEPVVVRTATR